VTVGPLPSLWTYSGPSPAAFPAFAFDTYLGFAGQAVSEDVTINWSDPIPGTPFFHHWSIDVRTSASFQNGATTPIAIPDLTAISGFLALPPSGQIIGWNATIFSSTGSSTMSVGNSGSYIEP
jgi:hypothetical protein